MKEKLTDVLARGDEDLMTVLVSSRINCVTCAHNKGRCIFEAFACDKLGGFVTAPGITVCMKWREGHWNDEATKKIDEMGK